MSRPVHEIAAEWVMAEEGEGLAPEREAARDVWLAEHPAHVAAYDAVRGAMGQVDGVSADPRILALRASALSAKGGPGPVWRMAAGVVGAVVLLGGGTAVVMGDHSPSAATAVLERVKHPGEAVYRTAIGERSTVTLPDGSVATLNTDTVLRIAYNDTARGVRLVRGQALFEVAHAKARPFEVYAGDRVITAIGTTFDVRLDGTKVKVALLEGKVRVRGRETPAAAPTPQLVMVPGELLEARPAEPMKVRNEDLSLETSWRAGVLVFDETPLAEAVAELNRYSDKHLVVDDPALAAFHVSGVFKTGDVDRFANTVAEILPVKPETRADGSVKLAPRA